MKNKFYEQKYLNLDCLCINKSKSRAKKIVAFAGLLSVAAGLYSGFTSEDYVTANGNVDTTFQVNVAESLSVSVTTPTEWANGTINTFLRNAVGVSVSANSGGFTASMYSEDSTNLTNTTSGSSDILPTLTNSYTRTSFPANYWGYSLGEYVLDGTTQNSYTLNGNSYGETAAGNGSSNYYPLVSNSASPITIMDGATSVKKTGSQNIYFGAKADANQASGTYIGTVVISVVTGTINNNDNPITPVNPAHDNDPQGTNPSYAENYGTSGDQGWTTYSTTSTSGSGASATNTTTTQVSAGDTRSSYANPAGVLEDTYSSISEGSSLATGLAVTATVAAASGYMFFIVANRREREDEEAEQ